MYLFSQILLGISILSLQRPLRLREGDLPKVTSPGRSRVLILPPRHSCSSFASDTRYCKQSQAGIRGPEGRNPRGPRYEGQMTSQEHPNSGPLPSMPPRFLWDGFSLPLVPPLCCSPGQTSKSPSGEKSISLYANGLGLVQHASYSSSSPSKHAKVFPTHTHAPQNAYLFGLEENRVDFTHFFST